MTAKNSDSCVPYRGWTGGLGGRLAICAALSAATFISTGALAQTAPSTAPAPPAAANSSPANPDQRADSAIAEDINTKLMASNTLRPLDLGIWVHDGTATLTGTVPTQELRTQAEDMVRSVSGVKNIDDKITIGAEPAVAPGFSGQAGAGPARRPPRRRAGTTPSPSPSKLRTE